MSTQTCPLQGSQNGQIVLYSNTKFRAYAAARFEEKNESGIPGSKKETHETPWSKTLGTKSSMVQGVDGTNTGGWYIETSQMGFQS